MSFLKRLLLCLGAVVAAGGILWCLDIHCLVKEWLGLPCPLCGTVRGIACLVQGNPVDALYWHPLFWLTPILMAWHLLPPVGFSKEKGRNRWIWIGVTALYLGVYVMRMILLFPEAAPMDSNPNGVLLQLWNSLPLR
ncbi:MAG TPA: DUF2752 domain-containing protein [Candidatus Egerieicola faecale]|uniref:DUF2752 domain-containing protein n=1 Tax=Candidatus Egerieicola faecale TaxID=2840774 RepID=A0A9D1IV19_9FIRM|nr:DUF2752 domain-containing protein [Candidatus Egerieicola faecale]